MVELHIFNDDAGFDDPASFIDQHGKFLRSAIWACAAIQRNNMANWLGLLR